jgi:hypothetical protein
MIDLDKLAKEWEEDSRIDKFKLDDCSLKSATLHSKYLEIYFKTKLLLKETELKYTELKKNKWLWFNGKMSKQEMDALGWSYDPFGGMVKPLKSEIDVFYDTDKDLIKIKARIDYLNIGVEVLKEILDNIKWRHTHIKNTIDFLRFTAGT